MKTFYLDTEFNGFGGELLSMALVGDGAELYLRVAEAKDDLEPWVAENVWPIMGDGIVAPVSEWGHMVARFLGGHVHIIADWPDDIRYFCQTLITGPGQMVNIPGLTFSMCRVDAYPTSLPGAIQHNALWDARALRHRLEE